MNNGDERKSWPKRFVDTYLRGESLFFLSLAVLFGGLAMLTLTQRPPGTEPTEAFGIVLLLLLPLVGQGAHLIREPRDPITGCVPGWCALLAVYLAWLTAWLQPSWFTGLWLFGAWSLLAITGWLGYTTLRVTRAVMHRETAGKGVRQHPLLALLYFLSVFLIVTYLLSFALAFAHRAEPNRHLRVTTSAPPLAVPASIAAVHQVARGQDEPTNRLFLRWRIFFEESSAEILADSELSDDLNGESAAAWLSDRERFLSAYNGLSLEEAVESIRERLPQHRVRVVLIGRSSSTKVLKNAGLAGDNYEVSRLRVTHVAHRLREQLDGDVAADGQPLINGDRPAQVRWDQIEWMYYPLSNADTSPTEQVRLPKHPNLMRAFWEHEPSAERSVDVIVSTVPIEPPWYQPPEVPLARELSLLDFLYFTIYTITTTGYGDIVPISPFAKLVSCIANLFELFFLVVFFNVLLVTIRDPAPCGDSAP